MAQPKAVKAPVMFFWGEDDFAVGRRARQIWDAWVAENPDADAEIIDGTAGNADEALRAIAKLREALQTLPFFGGPKSVWLRGCNFLGDERVSEVQVIVGTLADLARELAAFRWDGVRLLMTAGGVDRRRVFFKTIDKFAEVEHLPGLSVDDRDWQEKAENLAAGEFRSLGKRPTGDALVRFVAQVGPNSRQIESEARKVAAYVGERPEIIPGDVEAVVTRGRHARAFALADALGDRQLARALRHLDEELWSMQSDRKKNEIGLLYGLISKFRALLLAREMSAEGLIRSTSDYRAFAAQLKNLPADRFPKDKKYNPIEMNAYVLFRAAQQASNFTSDELVFALEELLRCNRRLVGSGLDSALVLQMSITRILAGDRAAAGRARAGLT